VTELKSIAKKAAKKNVKKILTRNLKEFAEASPFLRTMSEKKLINGCPRSFSVV
jgi:hypothetical protein